MPYYRRFTASIILLVIASLTSCSTAVNHRDEYTVAYRCGHLSLAEKEICKTITKEMPHGDYRESRDAVWLLLDRATIRFAHGDVTNAIVDYTAAIEAIDFYGQKEFLEVLGKVAFQDDVEAYRGEAFEQVLARIYFGLALLHEGDQSNAYALLRQAEECQQQLRERYRQCRMTKNYQLIDNALGKYLFALLCEKRCDVSNADILYRQTSKLLNDSKIPINTTPKSDTTATVVVISHNGNSPRKITRVTDASIASTAALEILLPHYPYDFALSSLQGIPTPGLALHPRSSPVPTLASIDAQEQELIPFCNVDAMAHQQLQQQMPLLTARGVARYLMRRSIIAAATDYNPDAGALADIIMVFANHCTKADERSWTTLPCRIDLARFDITPGKHLLTVDIAPGSLQERHTQVALNLQPYDLCVVNVFNLYHGVTAVLVPKRFTQNKEKADENSKILTIQHYPSRPTARRML